jgi:hypothetical protein
MGTKNTGLSQFEFLPSFKQRSCAEGGEKLAAFFKLKDYQKYRRLYRHSGASRKPENDPAYTQGLP